MKPRFETRAVAAEVRLAQGADGKPKIRGRGIVYNSPSIVMVEEELAEGQTQLRKFRERILPGAATRSLADGDPRVLAHHDKAKVLGRKSAGTARFREDASGVYYEADPPKTSYAADVAESLARGDIDGSSFTFVVLNETWSDEPDAEGVYDRDVSSIHVFEMGPVSWPAYPESTAAYRDGGYGTTTCKADDGSGDDTESMGGLDSSLAPADDQEEEEEEQEETKVKLTNLLITIQLMQLSC